MDYGLIEQKIEQKLNAGVWQVIGDSGELTEAATTYTFSGLDGDVDIEYRLIVRIINGTSNSGSIILRPNNDTGANYGYQFIRGSDTVASADRNTVTTSIIIGNINAASGNITFSDTLIYAKSGYIRTFISKQIYGISGTTVTGADNLGEVWNNTVDNITSLVISGTGAGTQLGIGSRLILLARRLLGSEASSGLQLGNVNVKGNLQVGAWQLVERYEVSGSAATSKTFSGLNGNSDILYKVRAKIVNGYNGATTYYIRPNNDSGSNYGYQRVYGVDTAAGASRNTSDVGFYVAYATTQNYLTISDFMMYAKAGYVRTALYPAVHTITGTTVTTNQFFGSVWNDSTNNITTLIFLGDQTGGLGIGTILELWKLCMPIS